MHKGLVGARLGSFVDDIEILLEGLERNVVTASSWRFAVAAAVAACEQAGAVA